MWKWLNDLSKQINTPYYEYVVKEAKDGNDKTFYVVRLHLPSIGWVWLGIDNYGEDDVAYAARFNSYAEASYAGENAVQHHRDLDNHYNVTIK